MVLTGSSINVIEGNRCTRGLKKRLEEEEAEVMSCMDPEVKN